MRTLSLIVAISFLQSCAIATTVEFERQLSNRLIGQDIKVVSDEMGYHKEAITAANGNKVYIYEHSYSRTTPVNCSTDYFGNVSCSGGHSRQKWCKYFFEANKSNKIVKVELQGNDCPKACKPKEQDKLCI